MILLRFPIVPVPINWDRASDLVLNRPSARLAVWSGYRTGEVEGRDMISRRTAAAIGETVRNEFCYDSKVYTEKLYDFLFVNGYEPWFCNSIRPLRFPRAVKEHFMRLHTGETQAKLTPDWDWAARRKLGQVYLVRVAEHILNHASKQFHRQGSTKRPDEVLQESLELDGYIYRGSRLIAPESDVLDTQEEGGILATLFKDLCWDNWPIAEHALKLSEDHWLNGKWDDCISNARKFLECILQEMDVSVMRRDIIASQGEWMTSSLFPDIILVRLKLKMQLMNIKQYVKPL